MATPTGSLRICVLSANDDVKSWAKSKATDERLSVYGTISTFNEQLQHFGGYDSSEYKNRKYQAGQMYNVMYGLNAEGNIISTTDEYQTYNGRTIERNALNVLIDKKDVQDIFTRKELVSLAVENAKFLFSSDQELQRWILLSRNGPEIGEHGISDCKNILNKIYNKWEQLKPSITVNNRDGRSEWCLTHCRQYGGNGGFGNLCNGDCSFITKDQTFDRIDWMLNRALAVIGKLLPELHTTIKLEMLVIANFCTTLIHNIQPKCQAQTMQEVATFDVLLALFLGITDIQTFNYTTDAVAYIDPRWDDYLKKWQCVTTKLIVNICEYENEVCWATDPITILQLQNGKLSGVICVGSGRPEIPIEHNRYSNVLEDVRLKETIMTNNKILENVGITDNTKITEINNMDIPLCELGIGSDNEGIYIITNVGKKTVLRQILSTCTGCSAGPSVYGMTIAFQFSKPASKIQVQKEAGIKVNFDNRCNKNIFANSTELHELLLKLIPGFCEYSLLHQHMLRTQVEIKMAQNAESLRVKMVGIYSDWVRLINGIEIEEKGLWSRYKCNLPAIIPMTNVDRYRMQDKNFIGWCCGGAAGTVFHTALIKLDGNTIDVNSDKIICGHVTRYNSKVEAAGMTQYQSDVHNVILVLL